MSGMFLVIRLPILFDIPWMFQFTVEWENNGELPYLDMAFIRGPDLTIKFDWYKKNISFERILNFQSKHHKSQILNCAENLVKRSMLSMFR